MLPSWAKPVEDETSDAGLPSWAKPVEETRAPLSHNFDPIAFLQDFQRRQTQGQMDASGHFSHLSKDWVQEYIQGDLEAQTRLGPYARLAAAYANGYAAKEGEEYLHGLPGVEFLLKSASLAARRDRAKEGSKEWENAYRELAIHEAILPDKMAEAQIKKKAADASGLKQADLLESIFQRQEDKIAAENDFVTNLPPVVRNAVRGLHEATAKTDELLLLGLEKVIPGENPTLERAREGIRGDLDRERLLGAIATEDGDALLHVVDNTANSLAEFGTVGLTTGGLGTIPYIFATGSREGYLQAKAEGLDEYSATTSGVAKGTFEAILTRYTGKLLGGGLENPAIQGAISKQIAKAVSSASPAMQKLVKTAAQAGSESVEELLVEMSATMVDSSVGMETEGFGSRLIQAAAGGALGGASASTVRSLVVDADRGIKRAVKQANDAVEGIEAAELHEGDPPRTDRQGFAKDTGIKKTNQAFREGYYEAVVAAQSEVIASEDTGVAGPVITPPVQPPVEPGQPAGVAPASQPSDDLNAALGDAAGDYAETQQEPQILTPKAAESLNQELRAWTDDSDLIQRVTKLAQYDSSAATDVIQAAQDFYDQSQQSQAAMRERFRGALDELGIDVKKYQDKLRRDPDSEIQRIPGFDVALELLREQDIAHTPEEFKDLLMVDVRDVGMRISKEHAIQQAAEAVLPEIEERLAIQQEGGQAEAEWYPERGVYMQPSGEVDYDPMITSPQMEWMRKDAESLGLTELDSPERRTWAQDLHQAKADDLAADAVRLAYAVKENPRALDGKETAAVTIRAAELKREYRALTAQMAEAEASGDTAGLDTTATAMNRVLDEFDLLRVALRRSGTEKGRNLAMQKMAIDQDLDLVSVLSRARAAKGAKITPQERQAFKDIAEKLAAAEAKVEELSSKVRFELADKAVRRRGRRPRPTQAKVNLLFSKVEELLSAGCIV